MAAAYSRPKDEGKLKIVILGPDGAGKSSVIRGVIDALHSSGRSVKMRYLKPQIVKLRRGGQVTVNPDPHGKPARSVLTSLAKIVVWLMEEWYACLFRESDETLFICDRYYHDLLVDPLRYRYGGPLWAARLIGMLVPQPRLWILLDAPAEVLQARKQEVPLEETSRQCAAYRAFVRGRKDFAIVDAAQSLDQVVTDVTRAIAKIIAQGKNNHG